VPPETESDTSWSNDSELSDKVEDLSIVTDSPPRSENYDLGVTAMFGCNHVPSGPFQCFPSKASGKRTLNGTINMSSMFKMVTNLKADYPWLVQNFISEM